MLYGLYGFVFGLLIPYIARRTAKFMPATLAYAIYRTLKPVKISAKAKSSMHYQKLRKSYRWRGLMYGIFIAFISVALFYKVGSSGIGWYLFFLWILILLGEIDYKLCLLPDILTYPLLLGGLLFALLSGNIPDAVLGAVAGYILPVVASAFLVWKNKDVFGGGDIKLLTAVGAWVGVQNLLYVIILSSVIFGVYALIAKKRAGAFGPAIVAAVIIITFL
jgi:prepilin signal peptidase PulO-like enzyme (type II secretory pathway)